MTPASTALHGPWEAVIADAHGYVHTLDAAIALRATAPMHMQVMVVRGAYLPYPCNHHAASNCGERRVPDHTPALDNDLHYCTETSHDDDLRMRWEQAAATAHLLNIAGGAGLDAILDDRHLIQLRADGWTLQHPLACRLNGTLFSCRVNEAASRGLVGRPPLPAGTYEAMISATGGGLLILPGTTVWIAAERKRIEHHQIEPTLTRATCGRSTRTGRMLPLADAIAQYSSRPCSGCYPTQVRS